MMKRLVVSVLCVAVLTGGLLAILASNTAVANNLASFELLARGRFKKLKNVTREEFLNKYGTPIKTRIKEENGQTVETLFYIEPGCRYRFTFTDRVFKKGLRNCL